MEAKYGNCALLLKFLFSHLRKSYCVNFTHVVLRLTTLTMFNAFFSHICTNFSYCILWACELYVSMRSGFLVHPSTFTGAAGPKLVSGGAFSRVQNSIQRSVKILMHQTKKGLILTEDCLAYTQSQINGI